MNDFSRRDSQTFRSIWRCFGVVGVGVLAVSVLVMLAPTGLWGFLGVAGLIAGGAAYLVWSARLLREYHRDLPTHREGSSP